jgi:hypothetical protein
MYNCCQSVNLPVTVWTGTVVVLPVVVFSLHCHVHIGPRFHWVLCLMDAWCCFCRVKGAGVLSWLLICVYLHGLVPEHRDSITFSLHLLLCANSISLFFAYCIRFCVTGFITCKIVGHILYSFFKMVNSVEETNPHCLLFFTAWCVTYFTETY